jgi:hypothetical protein
MFKEYLGTFREPSGNAKIHSGNIHAENIQGMPRNIWRTFREHSGNTQGTFRECHGHIQGTFQANSGNIQGTFRLS